MQRCVAGWDYGCQMLQKRSGVRCIRRKRVVDLYAVQDPGERAQNSTIQQSSVAAELVPGNAETHPIAQHGVGERQYAWPRQTIGLRMQLNYCVSVVLFREMR